MKYAHMVKEYFEAPVTSVPFSLIENILDTLFASPKWKDRSDGGRRTQWGRHYTWPVSTMDFTLEMARRRLLAKKQIVKQSTMGHVLSHVEKDRSGNGLRFVSR